MIETAAASRGLHVREHTSVLADAEKRLLVWIAERLPRWIGSDHLSALGLASMVAAGIGFAGLRVSPWAGVAVVAALAANWFGDSLDGTVARVRNQQRPRYGFYVDHVIDVAGISCLLAGLALSGVMNPLVALSLLCAYLLVSSEVFLATHAAGVFRISAFGIGPTELRIILAAGVIKVMDSPRVSVGGFDAVLLFDLGGVVATLSLIVTFAASAVRNIRHLYAAEPVPVRETAGRA